MSAGPPTAPATVRRRARTVGAGAATSRRRVSVVVAASVIAGALLAGWLAGSAAALWSDRETVTGRIGAGSVVFAVGRATDGTSLTPATGPDDVLEITLGPAEATTLVKTSELAVPIRVDALAQGNLGLRYEVELPAPAPDTILGAADLTLVRVDDIAACLPHATLPASDGRASTPVPATYGDITTPVTEYWCLLGRLDEPPLAGTYTNTGTVSAESEYEPAGGGGTVSDTGAWTVSDSDTWTANVRGNPAREPEITLGFTHKTFRPGG